MVLDHSEEIWLSSDGVRGKRSAMVHGRWTICKPTLACEDPARQAANKKRSISGKRSSRLLTPKSGTRRRKGTVIIAIVISTAVVHAMA